MESQSQSPFTIGIIQDAASPDRAQNLERTGRLVREAASRGAQIVCLPEYFSGVALKDGLLHPAAFE